MCRRSQCTSLLAASSRLRPRQHLQRVALTMCQMAILSGMASSLLSNSTLSSSRLIWPCRTHTRWHCELESCLQEQSVQAGSPQSSARLPLSMNSQEVSPE